MSEQFPTFEPGPAQLSADALTRMGKSVERSSSALGAQGMRRSSFTGGEAQTPRPDDVLIIQIAATTPGQNAYSFNEMVYTSGGFVVLSGGRVGTATNLPAIEMSGNLNVPVGSIVPGWLTADGLAVAFQFEAPTTGAPTIPCDFLNIVFDHNVPPQPHIPGWPDTLYLTFPTMDLGPPYTVGPASSGCNPLSYPLSGNVFPMVPGIAGHWSTPTGTACKAGWLEIPTNGVGGDFGANGLCLNAIVLCDSHQLRFSFNLALSTPFGEFNCPDLFQCITAFTTLIGIAKRPFVYSGSGFIPFRTSGSGFTDQCVNCNDANFTWLLSENFP